MGMGSLVFAGDFTDWVLFESLWVLNHWHSNVLVKPEASLCEDLAKTA